MAVKYSNSIKDARMTAALAGIDGNASAAYIEICTAAYAGVIVTITLAKPSFTEASQALTMAGVPKSGVASLAGTNTAAIARIKDGAGVVQVQDLSVGVGSGDIQLNSTSITQGQTVTITSGTITHAA